MNRSILRFLPLSLNASLLAAAALVACGGGNDSNGQLGDSVSADERSTPVAATRLSGSTRIAAGAWHTSFVGSDGVLRSLGAKRYGALTIGSATDSLTPLAVTAVTPGN